MNDEAAKSAWSEKRRQDAGESSADEGCVRTSELISRRKLLSITPSFSMTHPGEMHTRLPIALLRTPLLQEAVMRPHLQPEAPPSLVEAASLPCQSVITISFGLNFQSTTQYQVGTVGRKGIFLSK